MDANTKGIYVHELYLLERSLYEKYNERKHERKVELMKAISEYNRTELSKNIKPWHTSY